MSHIKSFSEESNGKEYLYTTQVVDGKKYKIKLGGPFDTPEQATFASKQASRLLGESSLQDYKNLVGAIADAYAKNNKRAVEGYKKTTSAQVSPNFVGGNFKGKSGENARQGDNTTITILPSHSNLPNLWNHEAEHTYYRDKGVKGDGLLSEALGGIPAADIDPRIDSDSHLLIYNRPTDETRIYQNPKVRFNPTLRNYRKLPNPDLGALDIGSPFMRFRAEEFRNKVENNPVDNYLKMILRKKEYNR